MANQATPDPDKEKLLKEAEKAHKAFLRWQEVRIRHLGHVVNLVLTLATASLGFGVKLVLDKPSLASNPLLCFSLLVLIFAVAAGLITNYCRLLDFRNTANATRARELKRRQEAEEELTDKQKRKAEKYDVYSDRAEDWGRCTWWSLKAQLLFFTVGIVLLVCGVYRYSVSGSDKVSLTGRFVSLQGEDVLLDTATGEWCQPWRGQDGKPIASNSTYLRSCKDVR